MHDQTYDGLVPIDDLFPHPANPNEGDLPSIRESMEANGWYGTVFRQKSTGYVIAGWHRSIVAKEFGYTHVPVVTRDVDDVTARRILAVDNESNRKGGYNEDKIIALLGGLDAVGALKGSGFTMADLADYMNDKGAGPDGPGSSSDYRDKFDPNAQRRDAQRRLMVLDLAVDRFVWLVDALAQVCEEERVPTNTGAILYLASERTGRPIPRQDEILDDSEEAPAQ